MDRQRPPLGRRGQLVDRRVRHRHGHVEERRRDLAERLEGGLAGGRIAGPHEHHDQRPRADQLGRDERRGRDAHHEAITVSSSGALAAIGTRLRRTSRVAGMNSAPPRISPTG